MTEQARAELKELQHLDNQIADAEEKVRDFDPLFAEVEEPALVLEGEVNTTRNRLQEMKVEERRLEVSVDEKRTRVKRLEERLGSVRNLREEAAVTAEHDMVKRALQNDEQEAYTLIDQMRKIEDRFNELTEALAEAQAQVEPRRQELLTTRDAAKAELASLKTKREAFAAGLDPRELKLYNGIRGGGRRRAVAELTHDGACGNCFGMVPLQLQNEIRHGTSLIRCEACGVILAAPNPDEPEEPAAAKAAPAADPVEEPAVDEAADDAPADEGASDDESSDEEASGDEASDDEASDEETSDDEPSDEEASEDQAFKPKAAAEE